MRDENILISFLHEVGIGKISKTNSNNLICTCPFHSSGNEKHPSFSISLDHYSKWNCFTCARKGLTFRSLVRAISFEQSRDLSSWENAELTNMEGKRDYTFCKRKNALPMLDWNREEEKAFYWKDYEHLVHQVHPYIFERGVTDWQVKKWKLGYDKKEHRLFIPIFDYQKNFVGYSGRAIPPHKDTVPKYRHAKGFLKNRYFYGEEYFNFEKRVAILVEGFMDLWALDKLGYENILAYMGTSASNYQMMKLLKWVDYVLIIPDNDKVNPKTGLRPGAEAAKNWERSLKALGKTVKISSVIRGRKDVAEWTSQEINYVLKLNSDILQVQFPKREVVG
jgi:DNA primase